MNREKPVRPIVLRAHSEQFTFYTKINGRLDQSGTMCTNNLDAYFSTLQQNYSRTAVVASSNALASFCLTISMIHCKRTPGT